MKHALLPQLTAIVALAGCSSPRPALMTEAEPAAAAVPAALPATAAASATAASGWRDEARDAVRRALPFIEREGTEWMVGRVPMQGGQACVSCHHVGYALWSHAEARRAGIVPASPAWDELAATAIAFLEQPGKPRALSAAQVMLAEPVRAESLARPLMALQKADGHWPAVGQFPSQRRPIEESDAVASLDALLALAGDRAADSRRDATGAARDRALDWLGGRPPAVSTEGLATRLVLADALGTVGAATDRRRALREGLLERQRSDGGWGFLAGDPSEAFSTGQALWALAATGGAGAAVERAARYLLARQGDDGSWAVPSAAVSREPSAHKDDIYRFWGTAWAAIGLARSVGS